MPMQIPRLLAPDRVACSRHAASKKRLLEQISVLIADSDSALSASEVFDSLIARERLGSTGFGHGVAIPHGRLPGYEETVGAFIKLDEPVEFDAIDGQPVDLLFAIVVPEHSTDEHLQLLSRIAEMFSDEQLVVRLRAADTQEELYNAIEDWTSRH